MPSLSENIVRPRLFLTGGTGFLGRHVITQAIHAGWEVVAICRQPQAARNGVRWLHRALSDVVPADFERCTVCVHLAAAGVTTGTEDWELCFETNVRSSLGMWRVAVAAGIRQFVVCGSCFEYGRSGERYDAIPVTAPLEPVTAYASSKAAATAAALGLAVTESLSLSVLRPFHLYGEGEPPTRFWPALRAAAISGADFPMTDGKQVRDFTPVENAARRFVEELGRLPPAARPVIRNVGTGRPRTLEAFAGECWSRWNARGELRLGVLPRRPNEILRYVPLLE